MARQSRGRNSAKGSGPAADDKTAATGKEARDDPAADLPEDASRPKDDTVADDTGSEGRDATGAEAPAESEARSDASGAEGLSGSEDTTVTAATEPEPGGDPSATRIVDTDATPVAQDTTLNDDTNAQATLTPEPAAAEIAAAADSAPSDASAPEGMAQASAETDPAASPESDSDTAAKPVEDSVPPVATGSETAEKTLPPPAPAAPPPPPEKKGGFFPMLLGGLVAGGIGYGAHYYLAAGQNGTDAEIAALQSELSELRGALADAPDASELARIESDLAELRSELASSVERVEGLDLAGEVEAGMDRLRAEFASSEDVGPDTQLVAQISMLSRQLEDRTARLDAVDVALDGVDSTQSALGAELAALAEELAQVRELAEHRIEEAEAAVDTALAGAGLETMRAALERGAAYPEALSLLREAGIDVPDALAGPAAQGVPTLEMLQESYPPAARAALRAALQQSPSDSTTERLGNFLRAQVGARSTAPREGDDPDAVMSRAAAALEAGDLDTTLAELDALPDAAMPALQDWLASARARQDAEAAIVDFATIVTNQ